MLRVEATMNLERDSQKTILLGHKGETLRKSGTQARDKLEGFSGMKIQVGPFVKVVPDWRQNSRSVIEVDWQPLLEMIAVHDETSDFRHPVDNSILTCQIAERVHFGTVFDVRPGENNRVLQIRCDLIRTIATIRFVAHPSAKDAEERFMKLPAIGIQRYLQASSALIILGLSVEIVTLLWFHPLSFVLFLFIGVILIGFGIVVYLLSLVFAVSAPAGKKLGSSHFASREVQKIEVHEERIEIPINGRSIVPSYEKTFSES